MSQTEELLKIIDKKDFKTFWECLDYLKLAGYNSMDAFGVTIKKFGEENIWLKVGWVYIEKPKSHNPIHQLAYNRIVVDPLTGIERDMRDIPEYNEFNITVGLIDENNYHLSTMYSIYMKALFKVESFTTNRIPELEKTCSTIIKFNNPTPIILEYLDHTFKKHFGFGFNENINIEMNKDMLRKREISTQTHDEYMELNRRILNR